MSERILLTVEEAAAAYGISVRQFHELRSESWMPKPIALGPRSLRWSIVELQMAVEKMPRQQHASEPVELRRARIDKMKGTG